MDRHEEARRAILETVELYRSLATTYPERFNADLARSLYDLAYHTFSLRHEEALKTIEEAVEVYQLLAKVEPANFEEFSPSLVSRLRYYASTLGRPEEGLRAGEQAVELYRLPGLNQDLADSLIAIRTSCYYIQHLEEGLRAAEEAVELYRSLAKTRPEMFNSNLADSLILFATYLFETEHREEGLRVAEEAAELYRSLATIMACPTSNDIRALFNRFASSLRLSNIGLQEEASTFIKEAIDPRRSFEEASVLSKSCQ